MPVSQQGHTVQQPGTPAADELLAKLEQPLPESWLPKKAGDTIVGTFLSLDTGMTAFGPAKMAVLATSDGERAVWIFYESLKSAFVRAKPEPGERIAVRYLGEEKAKNPTPGRKATYHSFRVVVDRPVDTSKPVDWASELGRDESRLLEPDPSAVPAEPGLFEAAS